MGGLIGGPSKEELQAMDEVIAIWKRGCVRELLRGLEVVEE
jgi:hypothetical protein